MLLTNKYKFNKGFSLLSTKQSFTQSLVLSRSFLSGSAFKSIGSTLFKVCSSEIFLEAVVAALSVIGRGRLMTLFPRFALGGTAAETARSTINSLGDHQAISSMLNNSIRGLRPSGLFEGGTSTTVSEVANTMNTVIQSVASTPVADPLVVGATTVGTAAVSSSVGLGSVLVTPFKAAMSLAGAMAGTDFGCGVLLMGAGLAYTFFYEYLFFDKLKGFYDAIEYVTIPGNATLNPEPIRIKAYDFYSPLPLLSHLGTQLSMIGGKELFFWMGLPGLLIVVGGWFMLRGATGKVVKSISRESVVSGDNVVVDATLTATDVAKDVVVSSVASSTGL